MSMLGRKVVVRAIEDRDLDKIVQWRNDPAVYGGFVEYAPLSLAAQSQFLESLGPNSDRLLWMVDWRDTGSELSVTTRTAIGMVGLIGIDMRNRHCEFGPVFIGEYKYRGKGAALEAELLVLHYAFMHLGMHKVFAHITESNAKVLAFHAKAGFGLEHTLKEHIFKHGKFESLHLMSVLADEFSQHIEHIAWTPGG
jgi:RimJ/RimL family protein N-acetyltransferase